MPRPEKVTIDLANEAESAIVDQLLQLYLHDFSAFSTIPTDAEGRYEYPYLAHYWQAPDRFPFLIRAANQIAGFALLRSETDPANGTLVMEMAEFFILGSERQRGIGRLAATALWQRFPGCWQISVLSSNNIAYRFWKNLILAHTKNRFTEKAGAEQMVSFSFNSIGQE